MKYLNSTVWLEKKYAGITDATKREEAINSRITELKNYNPSKLYELNKEYFTEAK